jgi:hypothetical protein
MDASVLVASDSTSTESTSKVKYSNTSFSWGPVITLSLPKYNGGTAHASSWFATVMLLPTGDLLLFTAAAGFAL